MAERILVLNGPNLNLLGTREPEIYGVETLADIEAAVRQRASLLGLDVEFIQSNYEGDLIDAVHRARGNTRALVINAGGLTHTSVALLDALNIFDGIVIEVHLSNIYRRESWRRHSYVAQASTGSICGFGGHGYILALEAIHRIPLRTTS